MSIDRNQRARLIFAAEAYERRTKPKGKRAGDLCQSGLQVLRCIAFRFLSVPKGAAWPSYDALQTATGLCRQTIARAIRRLEAAGFLLVTRRAGWTGRALVRETNLYRLSSEKGGGLFRTPPPPVWESLLSRRQPQDSRIPWEEWEDCPLKAALTSLGARFALNNGVLGGVVAVP
jgi:hypothetical protein